MSVPRLVPGDRVRFVSPASPPTREAVARGAELLSAWGLQVEVADHAFDRTGYLAGPDLARLADLDDALRDPGVRGIFATTGGKGAYRIAPLLDFEAARADPKPFVGFSDITYLHLALHRAGVPGSLHGPFVNWSDEYYDAGCAERLRRSLMEPEPVVVSSRPADYTAQLSSAGSATGVLVGGHFDSVSRAVGWALPDLDDAILLLEDHHGTGLGQVDRCLAQLVHSGLLRSVRGIALGTFGEFETTTASGTTLADVLGDWLAPLRVPILGGLPIGHGLNPASVPLGTAATIDVAAGTLTVAPAVH
ncbi:muramoyltetrapeptide carboxypeptidase [Friedmanniella luteola]|uniref:Muramoyltetrapeptide carboxypeptidase n=1 Tax=Friedmanniella luteola TaxID=546871 RepID=A0A1H1RPG8_9ACTN|nr:LD-carboxypeptidase [Friedmanniella luteola]SDS37492.1 muramoyltetrapeptide carboxypeptidase [Friedmanniella luteola]